MSWAKFSLRTLLIGMALLAIWLAIQTHRARNQQQAVTALTNLKVQIGYDWHYNENNPLQSIPNAAPPGPKWLRKAIGDQYFVRVVRLNFEQTETNDADLRWLESLPDVRWLSLYDTRVTNKGMKYLASLPKLENLYIFGTEIGDAGLQHVRKLKALREIQCSGNPISDEGLQHLSALAQLEDVRVGYTKVTDSGLKHLERLRNLRYLDLRGTQVSEQGVATLQKALPKCKIVR